MGRKPESQPSALWKRLEEALKEQGLPATQLGVARMLGMSHTSVRRWYHGEGEPRELATYRRLAIKGRVAVDWLITGRQPKYSISADPLLARIMETCIGLEDDGRKEVLRIARLAQAQQRQSGH